MTETTKPEPISDERLDGLIAWYEGGQSYWRILVVSALRELKALRQENEWIKVTERLPPAYVEVLWWKDNGAESYSFDSINPDHWDGHPEDWFTHWRFVPAPPAPRTEES